MVSLSLCLLFCSFFFRCIGDRLFTHRTAAATSSRGAVYWIPAMISRKQVTIADYVDEIFALIAVAAVVTMRRQNKECETTKTK